MTMRVRRSTMEARPSSIAALCPPGRSIAPGRPPCDPIRNETKFMFAMVLGVSACGGQAGARPLRRRIGGQAFGLTPAFESGMRAMCHGARATAGLGYVAVRRAGLAGAQLLLAARLLAGGAVVGARLVTVVARLAARVVVGRRGVGERAAGRRDGDEEDGEG